ncbi:glucoamylase family protein [Dictyobacter kobayashii]|nr:glucoamylase family protein [Dictyobacter kobayashii]
MKVKRLLFGFFLCGIFCLSTIMTPLIASAAPARTTGATPQQKELTIAQKLELYNIARRTWQFFDADADPVTHLPMDNIGFNGAPAKGTYTSPTNIGVAFWSIVSAKDLGLINRVDALKRANALLTEVEKLSKWHGFLFSWYDTTTGHRISGPGGTDQEGQPATGAFISTVDSAWYATGLIATRQVFPTLAPRATALLNAMNFGIFYDNGDQNQSNTAGQMYGGYNADQGPANFHYGVLNAETRIAAYIGIGTHSMPGDVWWRTWRTLPADFTWQGQTPQGYNATYNDPQSGKPFTVFEGHYSTNGINFVPSWGGSMFEGLMNNLVIPETSWGPHSFGLNDRLYAQAQQAYSTQTLNYPVWGLSPASTPDDTGNYDAYGARNMASNKTCCPYDETAVTPHASFLALTVTPQKAFENIQQLRSRYPGIYGPYGFYDSVNPTTGQIGHRYLVLDQAMIFAALDNALLDNQMQRHFAADPVIAAVHPYLSQENFSLP